MKCPHCWSEKAFLQPVEGWRKNLLSMLLFVPLKCHHCYHTFTVTWFSTLGQTVEPPPPPPAAPPALSQKPSRAAMFWAEQHESAGSQRAPTGPDA
jgi:hypothetical protein